MGARVRVCVRASVRARVRLCVRMLVHAPYAISCERVGVWVWVPYRSSVGGTQWAWCDGVGGARCEAVSGMYVAWRQGRRGGRGGHGGGVPMCAASRVAGGDGHPR